MPKKKKRGKRQPAQKELVVYTGTVEDKKEPDPVSSSAPTKKKSDALRNLLPRLNKAIETAAALLDEQPDKSQVDQSVAQEKEPLEPEFGGEIVPANPLSRIQSKLQEAVEFLKSESDVATTTEKLGENVQLLKIIKMPYLTCKASLHSKAGQSQEKFEQTQTNVAKKIEEIQLEIDKINKALRIIHTFIDENAKINQEIGRLENQLSQLQPQKESVAITLREWADNPDIADGRRTKQRKAYEELNQKIAAIEIKLKETRILACSDHILATFRERKEKFDERYKACNEKLHKARAREEKAKQIVSNHELLICSIESIIKSLESQCVKQLDGFFGEMLEPHIRHWKNTKEFLPIIKKTTWNFVAQLVDRFYEKNHAEQKRILELIMTQTRRLSKKSLKKLTVEQTNCLGLAIGSALCNEIIPTVLRCSFFPNKKVEDISRNLSMDLAASYAVQLNVSASRENDSETKKKVSRMVYDQLAWSNIQDAKLERYYKLAEIVNKRYPDFPPIDDTDLGKFAQSEFQYFLRIASDQMAAGLMSEDMLSFHRVVHEQLPYYFTKIIAAVMLYLLEMDKTEKAPLASELKLKLKILMIRKLIEVFEIKKVKKKRHLMNAIGLIRYPSASLEKESPMLLSPEKMEKTADDPRVAQPLFLKILYLAQAMMLREIFIKQQGYREPTVDKPIGKFETKLSKEPGYTSTLFRNAESFIGEQKGTLGLKEWQSTLLRICLLLIETTNPPEDHVPLTAKIIKY